MKFALSDVVFLVETDCRRLYIYVVNVVSGQLVDKFITGREVRLPSVPIPWDRYFDCAKCYDCRIYDGQ